jgi:hypothetical protein
MIGSNVVSSTDRQARRLDRVDPAELAIIGTVSFGCSPERAAST